VTVHIGGYQSLSILRGGPLTQIRETVKGLRSAGLDVRLFDAWSTPQFAPGDLFHLFAANIGTYHLAREIHGWVCRWWSLHYTQRHSPVRAGRTGFMRVAENGSTSGRITRCVQISVVGYQSSAQYAK
jgi:hypothetical protein